MGLDTVELILEAEQKFDVRISNETAEATGTVEQLARVVCELREQSGRPLAYDQVLAQLRRMISEQFGIPIDRVTPKAHFVRDLKLD